MESKLTNRNFMPEFHMHILEILHKTEVGTYFYLGNNFIYKGLIYEKDSSMSEAVIQHNFFKVRTLFLEFMKTQGFECIEDEDRNRVLFKRHHKEVKEDQRTLTLDKILGKMVQYRCGAIFHISYTPEIAHELIDLNKMNGFGSLEDIVKVW